MALAHSCPKCGKTLRLPSDAEGKMFRCSGCRTVFRCQTSVNQAAPSNQPSPPSVQRVISRPLSSTVQRQTLPLRQESPRDRAYRAYRYLLEAGLFTAPLWDILVDLGSGPDTEYWWQVFAEDAPSELTEAQLCVLAQQAIGHHAREPTTAKVEPLFVGLCDSSDKNLTFFCMNPSDAVLFQVTGDPLAVQPKSTIPLGNVVSCEVFETQSGIWRPQARFGLRFHLAAGRTLEIGLKTALWDCVDHTCSNLYDAAVLADNPGGYLIWKFALYSLGCFPLFLVSVDGSPITREKGWYVRNALSDNVVMCECIASEGPWLAIQVRLPAVCEMLREFTVESAVQFLDPGSLYCMPQEEKRRSECIGAFSAWVTKLAAAASACDLTWGAGLQTDFNQREHLWQSRLVSLDPRYFDVSRLYLTRDAGELSPFSVREVQSHFSGTFGGHFVAQGATAVVTIADWSQEKDVLVWFGQFGFRPMKEEEFDSWMRADLEQVRKEHLATLREARRRAEKEEELAHLAGAIDSSIAHLAVVLGSDISELSKSMKDRARSNLGVAGILAGFASYKFDRLMEQLGRTNRA